MRYWLRVYREWRIWRARQWLERRGYMTLGPAFVGVVLGGNCIAVGDRYRMMVCNPSGGLTLKSGSTLLP